MFWFLHRLLQLAHILPPLLLMLVLHGTCDIARQLEHADPWVRYFPVSFCNLAEPERYKNK